MLSTHKLTAFSFRASHCFDNSLTNISSDSPSASQEWLMTNFTQNVSCCLARILRSETMLLCHLLQEKASNSRRELEQRNFLTFEVFGKIRSAWCVILVKLYFLRLHEQLSSRLETYLLNLAANVVASEMGRLVLLLLTSKSFDSLESIEYLKGKGFAVTKEKNVDLKRKLFGKFQHNVLKSFSKRTLHFIRWSQTNWWNLLSRRQR